MHTLLKTFISRYLTIVWSLNKPWYQMLTIIIFFILLLLLLFLLLFIIIINVKIMFMCIYQSIYTICILFSWCTRCDISALPKAILRRCVRPYCAVTATSRRCRRPYCAATATSRRSHCVFTWRRSHGVCFEHVQSKRRRSPFYAIPRRSVTSVACVGWRSGFFRTTWGRRPDVTAT